MIVVTEGSELRLVTQPDHARFASQLLELWHRPELRRHPRRKRLLIAVREHDNGWRESDAAPRVDRATGRPYDFRSLPGEHRRELWRRGVERFGGEDPYVALLAAQHSLEVHRNRRHRPGWPEYLQEVETRRDELLDAAGLDLGALAADYLWLALADALSLAVCCGSTEPVGGQGISARLRAGELEIEPFPLAGATTFEIPCRWIPDRRYDGETDLALALGSARWERLQLRCRPPSEER